MATRKNRVFVGDFETTVYKGQDHTEVWAAACVELFTEDVSLFHSIGEMWDFLKGLRENVICYFHNLKFDGSFWLSYFLINLGYKQAFEQFGENDFVRMKNKEMPNNSVSYSISGMGQCSIEDYCYQN